MSIFDNVGGGDMDENNVRKMVRKGYAKIAKKKTACCATSSSSCSCSTPTGEEISRKMGYTEEDINSVPEGANLGLGCGNPIALASLKEGETVLDLGSGGGFDCFLAANRVGEKGKVIGVDMTPEMIERARRNARKGKYQNVEFRLGEIENLPAADGTVDVVISNCVINLSPNKKRVFEEAFRVLKTNGRLMISDIVLLEELPETIKQNIQAYIGCLSGAEMKEKYLQLIREAGFQRVKVIEKNHLRIESITDDPAAQALMKNSKLPAEKVRKLANSIVSVKVSGLKLAK
jgi:ubiquinone/menaquinone biosynthesis C-methylase UbiE